MLASRTSGFALHVGPATLRRLRGDGDGFAVNFSYGTSVFDPIRLREERDGDRGGTESAPLRRTGVWGMWVVEDSAGGLSVLSLRLPVDFLGDEGRLSVSDNVKSGAPACFLGLRRSMEGSTFSSVMVILLTKDVEFRAEEEPVAA
jgi:hypothetical protein